MNMIHLLALLGCLASQTAIAQDLAAPTGPVVLTVSGQITRTNGDGVAAFDQAMLDALEQHTTTTATPWLEGVHDFSGPTGAAILEAVGANGDTLQVIALNDYAADVPALDMTEHAVVFATAVDGNRLSVRDKGPLFLIYPFDEQPELFNEVYFGRSVWQIARIDVRD